MAAKCVSLLGWWILTSKAIPPGGEKVKLTAQQVKNAKPAEKAYKLADGEGLFLQVMPNGSRLWRLKYRHAGLEKLLALGKYPEVSLSDAREAKAKARQQIQGGTDPALTRKLHKASLKEDTFKALALDWHNRQKGRWSEGYVESVMARMETNLFPFLGSRPIAEIEPPELLACLRRIEARGALDIASRCKQIAGQVFRYAVSVGKCSRDPSADLRGVLTTSITRHHATITDSKQIGDLLRAMDDYQGDTITRLALQLAPLVFVRPGELRHAEWQEFNLEAAEWKIPAHKMKMLDPHIVPLSKQALAILAELQPLTGPTGTGYLFPSLRSRGRPISENTINAALRRLGYSKEEMTGHGFRGMASTLLHEQGWNTEVIERQLAHQERNKVKASYNHAQHLSERKRMMQHWADYLDGLRTGAKVVTLHARRAAQ
jgi:integrase